MATDINKNFHSDIKHLIYFLQKIKLYSFASKIQRKYFQKVEIDQRSKKNNQFLLDYYHDNLNLKEKDGNFDYDRD